MLRVFTDVFLECLDMTWELHRPYLNKSRVLRELVEQWEEDTKKNEDIFHKEMAEKIDNYINVIDGYSAEYKDLGHCGQVL